MVSLQEIWPFAVLKIVANTLKKCCNWFFIALFSSLHVRRHKPFTSEQLQRYHKKVANNIFSSDFFFLAATSTIARWEWLTHAQRDRCQWTIATILIIAKTLNIATNAQYHKQRFLPLLNLKFFTRKKIAAKTMKKRYKYSISKPTLDSFVAFTIFPNEQKSLQILKKSLQISLASLLYLKF